MGKLQVNGSIGLTGSLLFTSNNVNSNIWSQNSSFLHYSTDATSGHWFNKSVYVQGNIYAGSEYKDLVLTTVNYDSHINIMRIQKDENGYWGLFPKGDASLWVRTTSQGLIPYEKGNAGNGHCYLGTSSWYFKYAYIDEIYGSSFSGNAATSSWANGAGYLDAYMAFAPAETAIGPDDVFNLINKSGFIARRGSWNYSGNAYIDTSVTGFGSIDLAGCTLLQVGPHVGQYTQLYITAPTSSGTPNAIQGEMIYYINNGSSYRPSWYRVLTNNNYTSYTVTKTGSGASGTWGISITGNATYSTNASKLYSTDSTYQYGGSAPYYGYLTYSAPYWDFKVSPATPADVRVSRAYSAGTAESANWASGASYAQRVAGSYTGNGGAQGPSYIGRGNVKFNMMNQFPNASATNYMDCILMNTYSGGDVPRATAFGIERYTGRAWIAEGSDTSSTWERVYEVISTRNIASQSVNYASSAGNADTVDGWHADGFLQKHGWWNSSGSYSVDNLTSGIVFAYTNHGAPASWGHTIAFTSGGNNSYICQLHATGTNRLFMRNKSSDYGQKGWTELLTDSNYSQWCVPLSGGTMSGNLAINTNGNTMTIGSLNSTWCHFQSSADIPFYFNRRVFVDGCLGIYQMNSQGCGSSFPSSPTKGQIFFKI